MNNRIFNHKEETVQQLLNKIKILSFWWLKEKTTTFAFDYHSWSLNPVKCLGHVAILFVLHACFGNVIDC